MKNGYINTEQEWNKKRAWWSDRIERGRSKRMRNEAEQKQEDKLRKKNRKRRNIKRNWRSDGTGKCGTRNRKWKEGIGTEIESSKESGREQRESRDEGWKETRIPVCSPLGFVSLLQRRFKSRSHPRLLSLEHNLPDGSIRKEDYHFLNTG